MVSFRRKKKRSTEPLSKTDKIPNSFELLLQSKKIGRKNKMALKLLAKHSASKGMIEALMGSYNLQFEEFNKEHGRYPNEEEAIDIGKETLSTMLANKSDKDGK